MPGGLGLGVGVGFLLMPVLMLLRKDTGPVATFRRAGATSEATARRPSSLGIERTYQVESCARRGTLVKVGDGRYYVNEARVRQRRRNLVIVAIIGIVIFASLVGFLTHSMGAGKAD